MRLHRPPNLAHSCWILLLGLVAGVGPAMAQPAKPGKSFGTAIARRGGESVSVRVEASDERVRPGGSLVLAVTLSHQPGWHVHTHEPNLPASWQATGFVAYPTTITVEGGDGLSAGPIQWPEAHTVAIDLTGSGIPEPYDVYEGDAVAYVPVRVPPGASGSLTLTVVVAYQACNDTMCEMPQVERHPVPVEVDPAAPAGPSLDDPAFTSFDQTLLAAAPVGPTSVPGLASGRSRPKFLGLIPMPTSQGLAGAAFLSLIGVVGGLVLNLTPCVLPVIPIKVLTISKHAGNPARSAYLGAWMAMGVVAFWVGIGLPVALFTSVTDPSRIFGIWWVTLGIGVLIGVMGVGIMGAFNISLPQKAYALSPKADSAWGSFLFGLMTAVLGLPCFGFVAGALLAGAATLPAATIMLIFASLGVGMALPYMVLSLKPELISKIPRTGPASELVKQVMGLLLLAAAAYFVGAGVGAIVKSDPARAAALPVWARVWHWWAIAAFATAAGGWLVFRTLQITRAPVKRVAFGAIGLVLAGVAVLIAVNRTGKILDDIWVPYTEAAYRQALEEGKVVVLDFTADWCLNCQALKAAVLDRDPVKSALRGGRVVPFVADCTSLNAPGWDKLGELGQTGIPLLVVQGPGLSDPWLANAYSSGQVMEAIGRASGGRETAGR